MNHALFNYEAYIQHAIERIAEDRERTSPLDPDAPTMVANARQRLGSVLIAIGERVGGPAVRGRQPVTPQPSHTPLLGF
ncbi:MAG: hypothetical protein M3464_16055 [Chloroflexota bacterium]|nr:hypothetical protein [Chloroflexota bacterium]